MIEAYYTVMVQLIPYSESRTNAVVLQPGLVAEKITRITDQDTLETVISKENRASDLYSGTDISKREAAILRGIGNDPVLRQMGVRAPRVIGNSDTMITLEYLPFPSLDEIIADPRYADKVSELKQRIDRATTHIEAQTPTYLANETTNGADKPIKGILREIEQISTQERDELTHKLSDEDEFWIDFPEFKKVFRDLYKAQQDYFSTALRTTKQLQSVKISTDEPLPTSDYFDTCAFTNLLRVMPGPAHQKIVLDYVHSEKMFTLSDSRFANWLYDSQTDTLYKIDENCVGLGGFISQIAKRDDFNETTPLDEREAKVKRFIEQQDSKPLTEEYARLGLYLANMEAACRVGTKNPDLTFDRLTRANHDLKELIKIDSTYSHLQEEFMQFLRPFADYYKRWATEQL